MINYGKRNTELTPETINTIHEAILSQLGVDVVWTGENSFTLKNLEVKEGAIEPLTQSHKVMIPKVGEIEKYKGGCIGYHMGNNNVVIMYAYEGRTERSADDEFDSAKSFWDRFCKDRPDGPRKDVRIHVRYGAKTIRSEDNLFHYSAALNRSVDATFTPVRVG